MHRVYSQTLKRVRFGVLALLLFATNTVSLLALMPETASATSSPNLAVCHPVNGLGETKYGWNIISPDQASSHIDESLHPDGEYWKHKSNDGLRHDVYVDKNGNCPGYNIPSGSISGYKWNDADGNKNQNNGTEAKLPGWTIFIDENDNGTLDDGEISDITDQTGKYEFTGLPYATYTICEVMQTGWEQTSPGTESECTSTTLDAQNTSVGSKNFGNRQTTPVATDYCDPNSYNIVTDKDKLTGEQRADCFTITTSPTCGKFDVSVVGPAYGAKVFRAVYTLDGTRNNYKNLPVTFSEDENNGSIEVTWFLVGPESNWFVTDAGVSHGTNIPNYWEQNLAKVTIDTDCQDPPQVDPCAWPQVQQNDCFDVELIEECGRVNAILTGSVTNKPAWSYDVYWALTQPSGTASDWWNARNEFPATFAEDENGGSVGIYWWVQGTENGALAGSNVPHHSAASTAVETGGQLLTVDTDCEDPEVPEEPEEPTNPVDPCAPFMQAPAASLLRINNVAAIQQGHDISGCKFNDANANGAWDNGEEVLSGFQFNLYSCTNSVNDITSGACDDAAFLGNATSNDQGVYNFSGLANGTYMICETQRDGWVQTYPVDMSGDPACWLVPIVDKDCIVNFGNKAKDPGHVLGEETPVPQVLANTGSSAIMGVIAALSILGVASGVVTLNNKKN